MVAMGGAIGFMQLLHALCLICCMILLQYFKLSAASSAIMSIKHSVNADVKNTELQGNHSITRDFAMHAKLALGCVMNEKILLLLAAQFAPHAARIVVELIQGPYYATSGSAVHCNVEFTHLSYRYRQINAWRAMLIKVQPVGTC